MEYRPNLNVRAKQTGFTWIDLAALLLVFTLFYFAAFFFAGMKLRQAVVKTLLEAEHILPVDITILEEDTGLFQSQIKTKIIWYHEKQHAEIVTISLHHGPTYHEPDSDGLHLGLGFIKATWSDKSKDFVQAKIKWPDSYQLLSELELSKNHPLVQHLYYGYQPGTLAVQFSGRAISNQKKFALHVTHLDKSFHNAGLFASLTLDNMGECDKEVVCPKNARVIREFEYLIPEGEVTKAGKTYKIADININYKDIFFAKHALNPVEVLEAFPHDTTLLGITLDANVDAVQNVEGTQGVLDALHVNLNYKRTARDKYSITLNAKLDKLLSGFGTVSKFNAMLDYNNVGATQSLFDYFAIHKGIALEPMLLSFETEGVSSLHYDFALGEMSYHDPSNQKSFYLANLTSEFDTNKQVDERMTQESETSLDAMVVQKGQTVLKASNFGLKSYLKNYRPDNFSEFMFTLEGDYNSLSYIEDGKQYFSSAPLKWSIELLATPDQRLEAVFDLTSDEISIDSFKMTNSDFKIDISDIHINELNRLRDTHAQLKLQQSRYTADEYSLVRHASKFDEKAEEDYFDSVFQHQRHLAEIKRNFENQIFSMLQAASIKLSLQATMNSSKFNIKGDYFPNVSNPDSSLLELRMTLPKEETDTLFTRYGQPSLTKFAREHLFENKAKDYFLGVSLHNGDWLVNGKHAESLLHELMMAYQGEEATLSTPEMNKAPHQHLYQFGY